MKNRVLKQLLNPGEPGVGLLTAVMGLWYLLSLYLSKDHSFFWDTVQLASKHAHFFLEKGMFRLLLPEEIDSGHPPFFGWWLALHWKIFGYNLPVAHAMMAPWLLLWSAGIAHLSCHYFQKTQRWMLPLLLMADPYFAGHFILISPDVVLMAAFVWLWVGLLKKMPLVQGGASFLLGMISMRGMMVLFAVAVWQMLNIIRQEGWQWRKLVVRLWPLAPGFLAGGLFLAYHYAALGWVGFHASSPWAGSFIKIDSAAGLFKNFATLALYALEYGRFFLWFAVIYFIVIKRRIWPGWGLFICLAATILPNLLIHQGLMNPRYLLPLWLILATGFVYCCIALPKGRWLCLAACILLALGNLWVYPIGKAQGWDTTLAHWPYYKQRAQAIAWLKVKRIPITSVGTKFPEVGERRFRDLSASTEAFPEADLAIHQYVLFNSVMNDFSDSEIQTLQKQWLPLKSWDSWSVQMILYENPAWER